MKHINVALFVTHKGCPHMCSFCNQKTISGFSKDVTKEDIQSAATIALSKMSESDRGKGEIAFFGGSFTMIEREYMIYLLESAQPYIQSGGFNGIRISTRPDGISDEICQILKKYGVTAVELGAQSLCDRVLSLNERGHTAQDVTNAMELLKKYGFETGLQMMTGLYGSKDEDSIETAEKIIELGPDTIRIYPTVVLENTRLAALYREGVYSPAGVEESAELCAELIEMFEKANIKIIRVGLHSGGDVEKGFVAGAYHPAFKEICESKIYLKKALAALSDMEKGYYEITVSNREKSKMTGQKRCNIDYLGNIGYSCKILGNPEMKKPHFERTK